MKEIEIKFNFRTIKLVYKGKSNLSTFELEFVEKYKALHKAYSKVDKGIGNFIKVVEKGEAQMIINKSLLFDFDTTLDKITVGATFTKTENGVRMAVVPEFAHIVDNTLVKDMNYLNERNEKVQNTFEESEAMVEEIDDLLGDLFMDFEEVELLAQELIDHPEKYEIEGASLDAEIKSFGVVLEGMDKNWEDSQVRQVTLREIDFQNYYGDFLVAMSKIKGNGSGPSNKDIEKVKAKPATLKFDFRTINLKYNKEGALSPFELELLGRYYHLHRDLQKIMEHKNTFKTKYDLLDKGEQKAISIFADRKTQWDELMELNGKYNMRSDEKLLKLINQKGDATNAYQVKFNQLQKTNGELAMSLNPLINETDEMIANFKERLEVFNRFNKQTNAEAKTEISREEWMKENVDFSVIVEQNFEQWEASKKGFGDMINLVHNPFVSELMAFDKVTREFNDAKIKKPVIDPKIKHIKTYELPADSEQMKKYSETVDAASVRGSGIALQMSWAAVERNDTSAILDIVRVAQHKKEWLQNILFGIHISFEKIPISEPMGSNDNILKSPKILALLAHLGEIPMLYFFIKGSQMASYLLYADMLQDGTIKVKYEQNEMWFQLLTDDVAVCINRLFDGCVHFQEFCYGTGIDTKAHIEYATKTIYNDFNLGQFFPPVTIFGYDMVVEAWKEKYNR